MLTTPWESLVDASARATEVVLAAPYMKSKMLQMLLSNIDGAVRVVSRWTLQDIGSGVSDLHCRTITVNHGGHFFLHPRLHAKYYRFDDLVLVGSANLTAKGVGYDAESNLEILCAPSRDFDQLAFETQLFADSHEVSDWELSRWEGLDISGLPSGLNAVWPIEAHLNNWWPHTREPIHLWQVYESDFGEIASYDERTMARFDISALAMPNGLSYSQFRTWVASHLLVSPFFIDAAVAVYDEDHQGASYRLAAAWRITPRTAARRLGTAQAWKAYFLNPPGDEP